MAVSAKVYGRHIEGQYSATAARRIDWVGDTIKTSLHTSTLVPDQDAHDFFNDSTNEVTGTGYTAGGVALASKTLTYDTATNETRLDAADAAWTSATLTARIANTYKDTGSAATSPLISWVDFGADESVASGNFSIVWDATGVLKTTVA